MNYSFSVIIPVLSESSLINNTIDRIFRIGSGFDVEIIVADGDAEGGTINSIENNEVVRLISPKGRGKQMNKGASVAKGDIFIFLHADTELPEDAFRTIASVMDKIEFVGGAFDLGINSGKLIFRIIEKIVSIRTRLTRIPYGDQAMFIRKDLFKKIGGYKEIPIMEDLELMRRIRSTGYNIYIIPDKVKTSPRRWEKEGIIYCTIRNRILITLYLLGVKPEKLVKYYYPDS